MKLAFVAPRWSPEVRGGAETAARGAAERFVAWKGWEVEAFTSRALDHFTWANVLPEGDEVLNGVTVHRFTCDGVRFDDDPDFAATVIHRPRSATLDEAFRWVAMQGPTSPALIDAVDASGADGVVFTPYLFAPTVQGVLRVGRRAIMAAAAHDEPLLRLPAYQSVFSAAGGFAYYSPEERALVERTFHVGHLPGAIIGIGVDGPGEGDHPSGAVPEPLAGELADELDGAPYVVCLGRVEEGKGSPLLARYFEAYKERHPGPLRLVLAGPPSQHERYTHPDIHLAGTLDDGDKWAVLHNAVAFLSPSPYESFSIVLMEAWLAGLPALVNGRCAVTRGHAARSGGGLWFDDFPTFEIALERLEADADLRAELGARGRAYAAGEYSWPAVIGRYEAFLAGMFARV
ncbi:MAG: glycosyltransferase family 4 protein [Actinobacteria bacterium]|nr:glycosyltransferase family 4 protein [Actinomycetota bacterium]